MKRHAKSKHYKSSRQKHASASCLGQPPEFPTVLRRGAARLELSIWRGMVNGVRVSNAFTLEGLAAAVVRSREQAVDRARARRNRATRRLEHAMRMAIDPKGGKVALPHDGTSDGLASRADSSVGFPRAADIDMAGWGLEETQGESERRTPSGDGAAVTAAFGLERHGWLSDDAYNARLFEYAKRGHNPLTVLVLDRWANRICGPFAIRTLLGKAGAGDAGFISAVRLVATGRLVAISAGRLSLSSVVEVPRPRRADHAGVPNRFVPGGSEARA